MNSTLEKAFLVRDESGRGWCSECNLSDFTTDERNHNEDPEDEYGETFGEWCDRCDIGDEYQNTDENYTVIRIK